MPHDNIIDETDEGYQLIITTTVAYLDPDGEPTTREAFHESCLSDDSAGYAQRGYGG